MRSRLQSLRELVPATFLKYERLNSLFKPQAHEHASLLVNILFENNVFSLASSVNDPILVKSSYTKYSHVLKDEDEVFFRGYVLFCCGKDFPVFKHQMNVPHNSLKNFNYLQIIEVLESKPKWRSDSNYRIQPFTDNLKENRCHIVKHVLDCPYCYAKLSESVDFLSFKKIAEHKKLFGSNNSSDKKITQSDFDEAIADLEAQITELKARHPEFVETKNVPDALSTEKFITLNFSETWLCVQNNRGEDLEITFRTMIIELCELFKKKHGYSPLSDKQERQLISDTRSSNLKRIELLSSFFNENCSADYPFEGVKTKLLFSDYPATKLPSSQPQKPQKPQIVGQKQLQLQPETVPIIDHNDDSDEFDPNETVFDRMRKFAEANGIEIKTRKFA